MFSGTPDLQFTPIHEVGKKPAISKTRKPAKFYYSDHFTKIDQNSCDLPPNSSVLPSPSLKSHNRRYEDVKNLQD